MSDLIVFGSIAATAAAIYATLNYVEPLDQSFDEPKFPNRICNDRNIIQNLANGQKEEYQIAAQSSQNILGTNIDYVWISTRFGRVKLTEKTYKDFLQKGNIVPV